MSSLGFSEYSADNSNNDNTRNGNGNGKLYNRRNGGGSGGGGGGGGGSNRTLKIPRNTESGAERGLLQSPNGTITGITNENGNNSGVIQQAGKKIKQIKDYIENIHRKGGEDSDIEGDDDNILPAYPAQGMGVYATNVSHSSVVPGVSSNAGAATATTINNGGGSGGVRKTTQMNSLNPGSSYSSTLLEGMSPSSPYFEKLTGIPSAPKKDPFSVSSGVSGTETGSGKTSTYASQYYEQFVPYAETLANQLASGGGVGGGGSGVGGGAVSGTNAALIEKLNYIIHMLEEKKDEKTGHVIEELVLYCFLGVFIIFVIDTFTRAASGGGGGGRGGGMFGGGAGRGSRAFTASSYGRYQR